MTLAETQSMDFDQSPSGELGLPVSSAKKKRIPTFTHCWHECPACHKRWFHQIRNFATPDRYLRKCPECDTGLLPR